MRIGIDISPITRARTGVGMYCFYLLKHLLRLAPDCNFAGFSSGMSQPDLEALGGTLRRRHIPVPTRLLYSLWQLLQVPNVDRLLGGVDVYHATNYFLPPTVSARTVVTFHDVAFLAVPELCSPKIVHIFSRSASRFARRADAILACSAATKAEIIRYLDVSPERITVTREAVDEAFKPVDRDQAAALVEERYAIRPPFLLFVSTLEPRKNVTGLLRAFASLANGIPHTLVLAGALGWGGKEILNTLRKLSLEDRVARLGYIAPHSALAPLYCAADAFVFPTFYEGFGLPLLEALTCGCPVVTAKNSSVPEVVGEAAAYVDPHNIDSIAEGIRTVLEDQPLRNSLVAAGLEQAKKFSWEQCALTTLEVYQNLVS